MLEELKISAMIVFCIFVGMFLGGTSVRILSLFIKKNAIYLQILCGGLLMGLFAFELLPEAFNHFQMIGIFTGISLGILLMLSMEVFLHKHSQIHNVSQDTLFLLMIALIVHSIPTGIIFGISIQGGKLINEGLLAAFILHHVPEGMIIMSLIPKFKKNNSLFAIMCCILSCVIGLNILIGINMSFQSIKWNTIMMGMTIGTLGYVTIYELLWKKSKNLPKGKVALVVLLGMAGIHYFLRFLPSH